MHLNLSSIKYRGILPEELMPFAIIEYSASTGLFCEMYDRMRDRSLRRHIDHHTVVSRESFKLTVSVRCLCR